MQRTLRLLVSATFLISAPLLADGGVFKAQVFSVDSTLNIGGVDTTSLGGTVSREFDSGARDESRSGVGGGAGFEMKLGDPLRVGTGLGYITYESSNSEISYHDFIWNTYAAMDFVRQDVLSIYALGGISYHSLSLNDFKSRGVAYSADPTGLLNLDVGLGTRIKLNYSTSFGLEYKYTTTFSANDIDLKVQGASLSADSLKYTNVGLQNNELTASLAFDF